MPGAGELAAQLEALNESIVAFARAASPEDWQRTCPDESWPVGGVIRHIAAGYVTAQTWIGGYIDGKPIPIDQDEIDRKNELHAAEYAAATIPETVELLIADGANATRLIRGLTDEQLVIAHPVVTGRELTTAQLVKILIRHSQAHFDSARSAGSPR